MKKNQNKDCRKLLNETHEDEINLGGETEIDPDVAALIQNWRKMRDAQRYMEQKAALDHWSQHLAKILAA